MTDLTVEHSITAVDARALARIHRAAFPGFFLAQLGEPFLVQFYLGFVADPTAVIAICRDASRRPLGVAVGAAEPQGFFGRLLRRRFWGFVGASALAALRNPAAAPRLVKAVTYRGDNPPGRGGALFSSMCVDPAHSGKGIGSLLIRGWVQRARQLGAESAFLTTDAVGNDVVNAWYLREGWVLNDQFVAHGDRLMNRYEFDLQALRRCVMTRLRDVVAAGLGLLLLAPMFVVIALAIRLDSPGPVFFRQTRVGMHGRHFRIHKFRTMRVDAVGPAVSTTGDPRVTRVGRLLRRTKIDELPQLLDVICGDMSLVGPRPEVPHYVNLWPDDLRPVILSVRPGITDPATLLLRDEAAILAQAPDPERAYVEELLPMKARAYVSYVRSRSFLGDLGTIVSTLAAVVLPGLEARSSHSLHETR